MNKNANLAVSIAAGLLISSVAFEAMADGSSRSGSVRVATWNAAGVSDAAAAKVYVDGIDASWFGVANCGVDGVFTAFDGGAVGAGADATGAYWASGLSPDVTNDIAFTTASVDRRYHVHHVTLAGASTAVVQVQLDTSTPSSVTNQLNQIIADFEHTKRVVVMGEMSEHFEAFELLRAAGFVLANDDSTVGTTSSGASVANIAARGFVISDFAAHTTSLGSSYAISCTLTPGADYDSRVEYIEAPNNSGVSYIDTGLYPADDMGVLLRFSPLRTDDSTVCGVQSYSTSYKANFRWYFGVGPVKTTHRAYLSWDTSNPSTATRPIVAVGSVYDVYFNYKNDRNRRLLGVDNTTDYSLAIEKIWPSDTTSNTIYLFAYNNNGSAIGNTGNVRMYSAAFTKGTESVMDLVPVRKDEVGYFYNKIDGTLVGKTGTSSTPAYTWGGDLDSTIGGYIKLDDDADWTSSGKIAVDTATVIDLNGYSLTVSELSGYGLITDMSTGTPGELHIAVADGDDVVSSVELTGNLKLVKEGAGSLAMTRKWQTFTGGVLVSEGTAYSPASGSTSTTYAEGYNYWGPSGATITVSADATFDTKGNYQFDNKNFVLAGGTLANTGSDMNKSDWHGIGNVTLTADSTLDPQKTTRFTALGSPAEVIDLGGHTLTVSLAYKKHLYLPLAIVNGTLDFISGGYLNVESGTSGGSQTVDLRMNGAAFDLNGEFAVRDYYAAYTNRYNHGAASLKVYGTFTPAAVDEEGRECFHGCVLQDGATIDLSSKTGVFDTTATGWPVAGYENDADGARIVTFADGATVRVKLGNRIVSSSRPVVRWETPPENLSGLTFMPAAGENFNVVKKSDGLYVEYPFTLIIR